MAVSRIITEDSKSPMKSPTRAVKSPARAATIVVRGLLVTRADLRDRECKLVAAAQSPAARAAIAAESTTSSAQAAVKAGREALRSTRTTSLLDAVNRVSPTKKPSFGTTASERWAAVADANSSVRVLAKGHVHAKEYLEKDVSTWRDQISREFLSPPKPSVAVPKLALPFTPRPPAGGPRSPDHFERRYGLKRSSFVSPRTLKLTPLHQTNGSGTPRHDALLSSGRAALNLEARTACWKRARTSEDAAGDAHTDAAA